MANVEKLHEVLDQVMSIFKATIRVYDWLVVNDMPDSSRATLQACLQRVPCLIGRLSDELDDTRTADQMEEMFRVFSASDSATEGRNTSLINRANVHGYAPLHVAVSKKSCLSTVVLLVCGAEVNRRDGHSDTPLFGAVVADDEEILQLLVAFGADVRIRGRHSQSLLHCAADRGSIKCAKILLAMVEKSRITDFSHHRSRTGTWPVLDINVRDDNRNTPLLQATEKGHVEIVRLFVDNGADCDICNGDGDTPLMIAIKLNKVSIFHILLEANANINIQDSIDYTTLFRAVRSRSSQVVKSLLELSHCDCNFTNNTSALHLAVAGEGDVADIVALLMKHGASLTGLDDSMGTPLHCAISAGNYRCAEQLLSDEDHRNEILECRDGMYRTPLHEAAAAGEKRILQLLLQKGARIEAKERAGQSALHYAVEQDNTECAKELLLAGADPNCQDTKWVTPLHIAARNGCYRSIEVLLDHGADVNAEGGPLRITPFLVALAESTNRSTFVSSNAKCSHLLLRKGASVQVQHKRLESSPLHFAFRLPKDYDGKIPLVEAMLAAGADYNFRDISGNTPLHKAAEESEHEIILMLLKSGANPNMLNNFGNSPMVLSIENLRWRDAARVCKTLIQYGANVDREPSVRRQHFEMLIFFAMLHDEVLLVDIVLCHGGSRTIADWLDDDECEAIHTNLKERPDLLEALKYICEQPRSLKKLCRKEIRQTFLETPRKDEKYDGSLIQMNELALPQQLISYLFMSELDAVPCNDR